MVNINSGLITQYNVSGKKTKLSREEKEKIIKQRKERDSELVTGIFKNLENPGGMIAFALKLHPGDPISQYELWDGQTYSLPRGVWKHIATQCCIPIYKRINSNIFDKEVQAAHSLKGRLSTEPQISHKQYRFAFQSLEFMSDDFDINPSQLAEVSFKPKSLSK